MRGASEGGEDAGRSLAPLAMLGASALALLLFFRSLVPAWSEQDALLRVEAERQALKEHLLALQQRDWEVRTALAFDPQTLRVEIDRLGLTPEQLIGGPDPFRVR
jgi:hypothetical protein